MTASFDVTDVRDAMRAAARVGAFQAASDIAEAVGVDWCPVCCIRPHRFEAQVRQDFQDLWVCKDCQWPALKFLDEYIRINFAGVIGRNVQ